jgi:mannose/cellobiose epimerase-like protein (N-acyl-D-glucosamine 2-epimerase family)
MNSGGATASGGTVGSGGSSGSSASGGTTASGGVTASGGAAGSGGTVDSGGSCASGGTTASGGVTASGGAAGSGGKTGAGGATGSGGRSGETGGTSTAGGSTGGSSTGGVAGSSTGGVAGSSTSGVAGSSTGGTAGGSTGGTAGGSTGGRGSYTPKSEYLIDPDLAIGTLKSLADFRARARDDVNGGFFSFVNVDGKVGTNRIKGFVTSSRDAWTFARAFMVTGEEIYLDHALHALEHLFSHGWDSVNGGWYYVGDEMGKITSTGTTSKLNNASKSSFVQHYALLGIGAYCDATRDATVCDWFRRGRDVIDTKMWDSKTSQLGYYDTAGLDFSNPMNKGFTATVDGLTTSGIQAELLWSDIFHQRMVDLANIVVDRLAANMDLSIVKFGYPENYDTSWNVDTSQTNNDVGHLLKCAWVLGRAYLRNPDQRYRTAARKFIYEVLDNGGYNDEHGVPYTTANWSTGTQTQKAECWQIEQAITGGLVNWYIADNDADADTYLKMADRGLQFFSAYVIDKQYGGTWKLNNLDGTPSGTSKSNLSNVEYHSTETFWFTYLYGNLMLHRKPVALYYLLPSSDTEQIIQLNPVAIDDHSLQIQSATLDGTPLETFEGPTRTVTLASGQGGKLRVVFGPAS